MKKTHLMAAVAAVIALTGPARAQHTVRPGNYQPPAPTMTQPPRASPSIAVIDIQHVMKNYILYKANREALKSKLDQVSSRIRQEREALRRLAEKLKEFRPGSPNYKATEEEITKRDTTLAVDTRMQQREFAEEEAKMIYNTYQAIQQEVEAYCRSTGTTMVLQYDRGPVDPSQPNAILGLVSQQVVWHAGHDITDPILRVLNERANRSALRPGVR